MDFIYETDRYGIAVEESVIHEPYRIHNKATGVNELGFSVLPTAIVAMMKMDADLKQAEIELSPIVRMEH